MRLPHIMLVAMYATAPAVLFTTSIKPSVLLFLFVAVSLDAIFKKLCFALQQHSYQWFFFFRLVKITAYL